MEWLPGLRFDRTALKLAHLYAAMEASQGGIAVTGVRDVIGSVPGNIAVAMAKTGAEALACPFSVGRADPTRRDTPLRVSNTGSGMQTNLSSSV